MEGILSKIGLKLYRNIALIIFLISWEVLPRTGAVPAIYLPPLSLILKELIDNWPFMFVHLFLSLYRVLAGILFAGVVGVGAGLILGYLFPSASKTLHPLLRLFSQINPYTLLPLFIVFLGIGERAKIATVAWCALWPVLFHTIAGAENGNAHLVKTAKSLGASKAQILRKVILPSAGPSIFDGLRVGVEIAFYVLIAAEMNGGNGGLGAIIHIAGMNFLTTSLFTAGLCTILLGVFINGTFYYLQKRIFFWKETVRFFQKERYSGYHKPLGVGHILALTLLCLIILIGGYFQSINIYRRMNDGGSYSKFTNFFLE